jgi:Zn-dependent protease
MGRSLRIGSWQDYLDSAGQWAARQQNAPPATQALQPNIRAQAHNFPLIAPAWVRLSQAQNIVQLQIGQHEGIITRGGIIFCKGEMGSMLGLDPATLISRLIILVTALTVHEFAHAWTANYFGDDTPRFNGRLTLNPLAHLDIMGSLMLLVAGFGWAKPVPVNPYALRRRSPSALMWVSLAGPASNFLMAILAAIPFRLGVFSSVSFSSAGSFLPTLPQFLGEFIIVNLTLMLFNLIPLAPLDGDKIADYFFPPSWQRFMETIRPYGPIILLALLFAIPAFTGIDLVWIIIRQPLNLLLNMLIGY